MPSIKGQTRGRRVQPIASGRPQSDAQRGIGGGQTLHVEGRVGRDCRVMNRRAEGWRSGLKRPDDVSEGARQRPDEPGKAP
jgi:hypothetical protein